MNLQNSHMNWNPYGTGLPVQISSHLPSRAYLSFLAFSCLSASLLIPPNFLLILCFPLPLPKSKTSWNYSSSNPACTLPSVTSVLGLLSLGFSYTLPLLRLPFHEVWHCSWLLWFFTFPAVLTFSQTRPVSSHMLFIFFRRNFRDWDIVSDQLNVTINLVDRSGSRLCSPWPHTWFQLPYSSLQTLSLRQGVHSVSLSLPTKNRF